MGLLQLVPLKVSAVPSLPTAMQNVVDTHEIASMAFVYVCVSIVPDAVHVMLGT
jgi:hypothetical protein